VKGVPSISSTDKSVCATLILPYPPMLIQARAGVAQTLLSVLSQDAAADVDDESNPAAAQRGRKSRFGNSVAREGALRKLSPALSAGFGGGVGCAAAEAAGTKLARPERFAVAASAATKLGRIRVPRAERGAKFVKRAFVRDRRRNERCGRDSRSQLRVAA